VDGTALTRFKRAYIAALARRDITALYGSPMQPDEILGPEGNGLACWFADQATAMLELKVLKGTPLWLDETWQVPFHVQALGRNTDDTQEVLDQRACELVGQCMYVLAVDPDLDMADDTNLQVFAAVPLGSSTWHGGTLQPNMNAAAFEFTIELTARLKLGD
jgi:hypothetical protein